MKIVQFANKKFAVKCGFLFFSRYMGNEGYWWSSKEYIIKYCLLDTSSEARERAQNNDLKIIWKGSIR